MFHFQKGGRTLEDLRKYKFGEFWNKLLSAIAMAIVVAVTPGAIISPFISGIAEHNAFFAAINTASNMCMYIVPVAAGVLAANEFGFNRIEKASVALASLIGSGAVVYSKGTWTLVGMGDLINTILIITIAIVAVFLTRNYVGSFSIIIEPILCGTIIGAFGMWSYTYVHMISTGVGNILNVITKLQPTLMCTLIAMAFALIIATPLSTVGLAYAIGISGIAGGAASVGVTSCFMIVAIATFKKNGAGVSFAMFWGGVKMMLANFVKHPRMFIPIAIVGAITGFIDSFIRVKNGAAEAGFGQPVGPINSYTYMTGSPLLNICILALIYFILPILISLVVYLIIKRFPKLYQDEDWKVNINE